MHKNKETKSQQTMFSLTIKQLPWASFLSWHPSGDFISISLPSQRLKSLVQTAAHLSSLIVDPDLVHLGFHLRPYLVPIIFCLWAAGCIITSTTSIGIRKYLLMQFWNFLHFWLFFLPADAWMASLNMYFPFIWLLTHSLLHLDYHIFAHECTLELSSLGSKLVFEDVFPLSCDVCLFLLVLRTFYLLSGPLSETIKHLLQ